MKTKRSLSKLAGVISTAGLIAASIAPNTLDFLQKCARERTIRSGVGGVLQRRPTYARGQLHIPAPLRPWIFMFAIAWTLLVVSGVFSSW